MFLKCFICAAIFNLFPVYVFTKNASRVKRSDDFEPCNYEWLHFGEKCYSLEGKKDSEKLNWDDAEVQCMRFGGHLVSIHSAEELAFIASVLLRDIDYAVWIGLNDRVHETKFSWSDGSNFDFSNWPSTEPSGTKYGNEDCVEISSAKFRQGRGSWNDLDCNRILPFICQTKTNHPTILNSPTEETCPKSPVGWKDFGGEFCYFIEAKNKLNWYEAEFDCKRRGGNLVSIHSKEENDVLNTFFKYTGQRFYIGLFRLLIDENVFAWSDGSDLDYQNWAAGQPNNDDEKCTVTLTTDKLWHDYPCTFEFGYMCSVKKISPNTAVVGKTSCTDRPTILKSTTDGFCPKSPVGWRDLGGEFCYFMEAENKFNWYEADFHCKRRGGNLLSIHSKEESDVLNTFFKYTREKFFIGLFRLMADENVFAWSDGSDLDYENWAAYQPNSADEKCTVMFITDMVWHDYPCTYKFGYICSVRKMSPNAAVVGTTPFSVIPDTTVAEEIKCPECTECPVIPDTTVAEETKCPECPVIPYTTVAEEIKCPECTECPVIPDTTVAEEIKCPECTECPVMPNTTVSEENKCPEFPECPVIPDTTAAEETKCPECPSRRTILKSTTDGFCPKSPVGWRDLGGEFCYFMEAENKSNWYEADFHCKRRGGNLLSIHSKEESDALHTFFKYTRKNFFIGLIRLLADENVFAWSDGSDLDYENWAPYQPNNADEKCTVMFITDMVWHDYPCTYKFGYICSIRKMSPNAAVVGTTPFTIIPDTTVAEEIKCPECTECPVIPNTTVAEETKCPEFPECPVIPDTTVAEEIKCPECTECPVIPDTTVAEEIKCPECTECPVMPNTTVSEENKCPEFPECPVIPDTTAAEETKCPECPSRRTILKSTTDGFCPKSPVGWRDLGGEFCYFMEAENKSNWYEADFHCKRRGGNLLSIHSKEESDALHTFFKYTRKNFFIGLIRLLADENVFAWSDGSDLDYENWAPYQPNNADEKCTVMFITDMVWHDYPCTYKFGYICSIRKMSPNAAVVGTTPFTIIPDTTVAEEIKCPECTECPVIPNTTVAEETKCPEVPECPVILNTTVAEESKCPEISECPDATVAGEIRCPECPGYVQNDPEHFTVNVGENIILHCAFEFPENKPVPHVIQWKKQGIKIPIYIWYDGYPPHVGDGYEGRVFLAHQASLNLTNVHESDQGWYECKVYFLPKTTGHYRPQDSPKNGTWVHLDVRVILNTTVAEEIKCPEIPQCPDATVAGEIKCPECTECPVILNSTVAEETKCPEIPECPDATFAGGIKCPECTECPGYVQNDPEHFTANVGENVILHCAFEFPENKPVPHVIQWKKQGIKIPIYVWYDEYPPHVGDGYEGRVFLAHQASLNLTNVHESDQGWYECKVYFLPSRPQDSPKNGTWVHLDVRDTCSQTQCEYYAVCELDNKGRPTCVCPLKCLKMDAIVCGNDGVTYMNECELKVYACRKKLNITVASRGPCGVKPPEGSGSGHFACEEDSCRFGGLCDYDSEGQPQCVCPFECPATRAPVCGSDGNVYDSDCHMKEQACKVQKKIVIVPRNRCQNLCINVHCMHGARCEDGRCVCPSDCPETLEPVCASDGATYPNECEMSRAACVHTQELSVLFYGECEDVGGSGAGVCINMHCQHGARCEDGRCVCPTDCPETLEPVCASDGATYPNECEMRRAACVHTQELSVLSYGECKDVGGSGADLPTILISPTNGTCPESPVGWRDLGGEFCYFIEAENKLNWYEADFHCKRRGGNLLSIHSKEENNVLHTFFEHTQQKFFIGLFRLLADENVFVWSDGSDLDYKNWATDQPNNADEKCTVTFTPDMLWHDSPCTDKFGYICSVRKTIPNSTISEAIQYAVIANAIIAEKLQYDGISNTTVVETTQCTGHISYKVLFVISVCILLVIIFFGFAVYFFRRWKMERRKHSSTDHFLRPLPSTNHELCREEDSTMKYENPGYEMML